MSDNQTEFKGWARVEVMGHQTHIGYVETQAFGGVVLFRVDQPAIPACEETLVRPQWVGDTYAHAGSVVERGAMEGASVLIGAGSIYRIIPCDESAAMAAIKAERRAPLMIVTLAEVKAIASAPEDFDDDGPEGHDDDSMPGGF